MPKPEEQTILLVEDTLPVARLYEECLREEGHNVVAVEDGQSAIAALDRGPPSALVLDLLLPDISGMEVLTHAQKLYPDLPVVVVTALNSVNVAVEAMKRGAVDFLVKPFPPQRLTTTVHNALLRKALAEEVTELRQALGQVKFHDFIGQSPAMQAVYRVIDSVASSKASVFIRGESGTGKELAAQAIHKASPRRAKSFIPLNCAIGHDQLEAQLFGRSGAARTAHGGTLFLDEVCEMPLELQVKLLRFVQTGEVALPGSAATDILDVRVVAATERDPLAEMHAARFREDLYYRLNVIPLEMPPLSEREDDVLLLAHHFLSKFSAEEGKAFTGFDPEILSLFRRYDWPGNVRQLENVVRNVVVLNGGATVTPDMMPADLRHFAGESLMPANQNIEDLMLADPSTALAVKPLWQAEKDAVMKALDFTRFDINQAAVLLEVSPSTLYRKLEAWRAESAVA